MTKIITHEGTCRHKFSIYFSNIVGGRVDIFDIGCINDVIFHVLLAQYIIYFVGQLHVIDNRNHPYHCLFLMLQYFTGSGMITYLFVKLASFWMGDEIDISSAELAPLYMSVRSIIGGAL